MQYLRHKYPIVPREVPYCPPEVPYCIQKLTNHSNIKYSFSQSKHGSRDKYLILPPAVPNSLGNERQKIANKMQDV